MVGDVEGGEDEKASILIGITSFLFVLFCFLKYFLSLKIWVGLSLFQDLEKTEKNVSSFDV